MLLTTPVDIPPAPFAIDHGTPLLLLGSCFADEMGLRLQQAGFEVLCNPFGTLYNPLSIATLLRRALDDEPIGHEWLVQADGHWHSWLHHSRFSHTDRDQCLLLCNQSIHRCHQFLEQRPTLLLTFGTAYAFFLADEELPATVRGQVVANCHKLPARTFARHRLTVQEIVDVWTPLLSLLSPSIAHLVLTVSPIRHLADGAHGNQLSKATLLLAIEQLLSMGLEESSMPPASYFPSYEILLDELRDYRFYARDLCHPSDLAADLIFQRFQQTYMTEATLSCCQQHQRQARQSAHRPILQE